MWNYWTTDFLLSPSREHVPCSICNYERAYMPQRAFLSLSRSIEMVLLIQQCCCSLGEEQMNWVWWWRQLVAPRLQVSRWHSGCSPLFVLAVWQCQSMVHLCHHHCSPCTSETLPHLEWTCIKLFTPPFIHISFLLPIRQAHVSPNIFQHGEDRN